MQNTGHADLVERPDGSWAIVYHGVRARGSSPEWHVLGRETFADEVVWTDGWPVLTGHVEPASGRPAVTEDLDRGRAAAVLGRGELAALRRRRRVRTAAGG